VGRGSLARLFDLPEAAAQHARECVEIARHVIVGRCSCAAIGHPLLRQVLNAKRAGGKPQRVYEIQMAYLTERIGGGSHQADHRADQKALCQPAATTLVQIRFVRQTRRDHARSVIRQAAGKNTM